jgi:hypothetical protein
VPSGWPWVLGVDAAGGPPHGYIAAATAGSATAHKLDTDFTAKRQVETGDCLRPWT